MYCNYCGKNIKDEVKFCPECGMAIQKMQLEGSVSPGNMNRTLEFVLGLIGGILGVVSAVLVLFNKLDLFTADSGLGSFGIAALLFSLIGIIGAVMVSISGKLGGIIMILSSVFGILSIFLGYIISGILLLIAGIISVIKPDQTKDKKKWYIGIPSIVVIFPLILLLSFLKPLNQAIETVSNNPNVENQEDSNPLTNQDIKDEEGNVTPSVTPTDHTDSESTEQGDNQDNLTNEGANIPGSEPNKTENESSTSDSAINTQDNPTAPEESQGSRFSSYDAVTMIADMLPDYYISYSEKDNRTDANGNVLYCLEIYSRDDYSYITSVYVDGGNGSIHQGGKEMFVMSEQELKEWVNGGYKTSILMDIYTLLQTKYPQHKIVNYPEHDYQSKSKLYYYFELDDGISSSFSFFIEDTTFDRYFVGYNSEGVAIPDGLWRW